MGKGVLTTTCRDGEEMDLHRLSLAVLYGRQVGQRTPGNRNRGWHPPPSAPLPVPAVKLTRPCCSGPTLLEWLHQRVVRRPGMCPKMLRESPKPSAALCGSRVESISTRLLGLGEGRVRQSHCGAAMGCRLGVHMRVCQRSRCCWVAKRRSRGCCDGGNRVPANRRYP